MTAPTHLLLPSPAPADVAAARAAAGISQPAMAELLGLSSHRTVQAWEAGQNPVNAAQWALFLLATGQHPDWVVSRR